MSFKSVLGMIILILAISMMYAVATWAKQDVIASQIYYASKQMWTIYLPNVHGSGAIDHMEMLREWHVSTGDGAISASLTATPGYAGQAIQLNYNLGSEKVDNWAQLRRDFVQPFELKGESIRLYYRGIARNTLQVGLVSESGENYFAIPSWPGVTHVPQWTFATWDVREFYTSVTSTE